MNEFSKIIDNIKIIIANGEKRRVADKEVAEYLNITVQNFSNYKNENRIPLEYILNFCAKKRISINWILFNQLTSSLEDETMKYVGLTYFPRLNGSCGGGAAHVDYDERQTVKFPWYMVENLKDFTKLENIHILKICGDSMEPELSDKDKVFVDTSKREINQKDIFVLSTPYGVYVKKIHITPEKNIVLHSVNPDCPDEEIDYEVIIVGTVVGKY